MEYERWTVCTEEGNLVIKESLQQRVIHLVKNTTDQWANHQQEAAQSLCGEDGDISNSHVWDFVLFWIHIAIYSKIEMLLFLHTVSTRGQCGPELMCSCKPYR